MPDADPPLATKPQRSTGSKIVAVAACGVIVSLGLCKVGFYMSRNVHDGAPPDLAFLGGLAFCFLSLLSQWGSS